MRNTILFILALILAIWFVLTSWIWFYFWCVVFSFPAGILALVLWSLIRSEKKRRNFFIPAILGLGSIISIFSLFVILNS